MTAAAAFLLLVGWVVPCLRISAPINRTLTAAAGACETPDNARAPQRGWDRIIVPAPSCKAWPSPRRAGASSADRARSSPSTPAHPSRKAYRGHVPTPDLHPAHSRSTRGLRERALPRHIHSLRTFGVTTHGIWTDHDAGAHRLMALISYPRGADPASVTAAYMAGPEFRTDMEGFDVSNIINVEELLLDPTAASPLS